MKQQWYDESQLYAIQNWKNLAFGMFVHFGLYSLCGGEWDGKPVRIGYSEQILSHGPVAQADYEALTQAFTLEHFDADSIAQLAKDAGMKYIVMTTKHHDGFCMFDTATTTYSSMNSACHKDLVKEMSDACARHDLAFGLYFSWIDWHCSDAVAISPHNSDPLPAKHMDYTMKQLTELLTNYGDICELWMDMGAPTVEQSQMVAELAHRLQPGIMVNGRVWNDYGNFLTMGDNKFPEYELDLPWQTPASIYHETWGYRSWQERVDLEGKVQELTDALYGVLDRGGNYLLNIGPMGDGSIVPFERDVLCGIGKTVKERGLVRKPLCSQSKQVEISQDVAEIALCDGTGHFRYTGGEYYTLRPIKTAMSWNVVLDTSRIYSFEYELPEPLAHETKLCLDTNDRTIIFSLKQGISHFTISSSVALDAGDNEIVLYTVGNPMTRSEFELSDIKIVMRPAGYVNQ